MNKLSTKQRDEIAARYRAGETIYELGDAFGRAATTILYHLRLRGVPRRSASETKRRCTVNASAFDSVTEESAYWIGFLMADGSVYYPKKDFNAPVVSVTAVKKDADHIKRFRQFLGSTHTVHFYRNRDCVSFAVSSRRLADALASFGVLPRKSHTAKVSGLEFNRHFWRGVLDGDGHVSPGGRKKVCGLCGSESLMTQFADFVDSATGTRPKVYFDGGVYKVRMAGATAARVLGVLYADCSIALPRKLERAQILMEYVANR